MTKEEQMQQKANEIAGKLGKLVREEEGGFIEALQEVKTMEKEIRKNEL